MSTITFDTDANAMYIYIRDEKVVLQQEMSDGVIVDIGESGLVVGIEILSPGEGHWNAQEILNRYSPSFDIAFADWLLKVSEERLVWKRLNGER